MTDRPPVSLERLRHMRPAWIALLILVGCTALYCLSMPILVAASGDAVAEVTGARATAPPERPSHLLLSASYHDILSLWKAAGYTGPDFIPLQTTCAFLGAFSCALLFLIVIRLGGGVGPASLLVLILAVSHVHWLHARESETGMPPHFMLVSTIFLAVWAASTTRTWVRWVWVVLSGLTSALAVLYALYYVTLLPAMVILLWILIARHGGERTRPGPAAASVTFVVIVATVTAVSFLGAAQRAQDAPRLLDVYTWLVSHPAAPQLPDTRQITTTNALRAVSGLVNALAGPTAVTTALKEWLRGSAAVRIPTTDTLRFALSVVLLLGAAGLLARRRDTAWPWPVTWCALIPVALFNVIWLGSDPQFWLPVLPILIIHLALALGSTMTRPVIAVLITSAGLLLAVNAPYAVPTFLDRDGGREWRLARAYAGMASSNDLLLWVAGWPGYLRALGEYRHLSLAYSLKGLETEEFTRAVRTAVDSTIARPGRVFAYGILPDPSSELVGAWDEIETLHGVSRSVMARWIEERYATRVVSPDVFDGSMIELSRERQETVP